MRSVTGVCVFVAAMAGRVPDLGPQEVRWRQSYTAGAPPDLDPRYNTVQHVRKDLTHESLGFNP